MNRYELMYILKPDLGEEQLTSDIERFNEIIVKENGTIEKTEKWGRRKLSYEIDGHSEGFYTVVTFTAPGDVANEMTRLLRISEDVMRSMVVRLEH